MYRRVSGILVALGLATAIHVDWHLARPAHHPLSLGLAWHWLGAIPVFALVAWYIARVWPDHRARSSTAILGSAILLAGVLEPAWEFVLEGVTFEWAFGAERSLTLLAFVAMGLITYWAVLFLLSRRESSVAG